MSHLFVFSLIFFMTQNSLAMSIIGHRGARASWPENSPTGFKKALESGIDYLETDMRITADLQLVLHHDETINPKICRHLNGNPIKEDYYIGNMTLQEIKQFDCGSLVHPSFPNQQLVPGSQIMSLYELTELVENNSYKNKVRLLLEMKLNKNIPNPDHQIWSDKLAEALISKGLLGITDIDSFDQDLKQKVIASLSSLSTDWPNQSVKAYPFQILTRSWVSWLQSSGHKVFPWTVNSPQNWDEMILLGVDGIITDDPIGLKHHIESISKTAL